MRRGRDRRLSELGISNGNGGGDGGDGGFMCLALACCLAYIGCLAPFYVAKQKLWPNFVASEQGRRGREGGGWDCSEGVCNKWDICQLLLLPSLLLLLLLSMLLAAIKTRKNVYFGKGAILFSFCLFLSLPPFARPLSHAVVLCAFAFLPSGLDPCSSTVQVVLCVNRHKYMCT